MCFLTPHGCCFQVVIKEKVLELLLYFTKHEDEEVKTKAIIGLGRTAMGYNLHSNGYVSSIELTQCN